MKIFSQPRTRLILSFLALGGSAALWAQGQQKPTLAAAALAPSIGGCPVFPANNIWNARVDTLPVDPSSALYIASEGGSGAVLHPDFGTVYNGAPNGLPFVVVPASQPAIPIVFTAYGGESDPGPYPVPPSAQVEGGSGSTGDRHVLVLQSGTCKLYEMFSAYAQSDGSWQAASGAVFDLTKNAPLRTAGWTSSDAAGLPIFPGLVRYDEVQQALAADGLLHHALRFTVPYTRTEYLWPARHWASYSSNLGYPPMGQRFRLKAGVNTDFYPGTSTAVSPINKVILQTLKQYGMFVADNGGSFFVSGAPDPRWSDDDLHLLVYYRATDFDAVNESSLEADPNSGAVVGSAPPTVALTAPASGAAVSGTVTLTAQARSNTGIASVQFLLDGNSLGAAVTGPGPNYSFSWQTSAAANGAHSLAALAVDVDGLSATSAAVQVTVANTVVTGAEASFVRVDPQTVGNWQGVYGSDGSLIALDTAHLPGYASVNFSATTQLWNWTPGGTADPRAPLRYGSNSAHIASTYFSQPGFSLDVNLNDGQPHQLALYLLDWDRGGRAESITIKDAASQAVLDSRTAADFVNGQYFVWNVRGHVLVQVVWQGGYNAVLSGIFFDPPSGTQTPPPAAAAAFIRTDTATLGNWQGVYGGDGSVIPLDSSHVPAYASVTFGGSAQLWNWTPGGTNDPRALLKYGSAQRTATTYYNQPGFVIDVSLTDAKAHQLAFYVMDWDRGGRSQTIAIRDAATNAILDSQTVANYIGGKWLVWKVQGHVLVDVRWLTGYNALINGVFFDSP
jgi:hypothetical protein